jgi:hypothetical protein
VSAFTDCAPYKCLKRHFLSPSVCTDEAAQPPGVPSLCPGLMQALWSLSMGLTQLIDHLPPSWPPCWHVTHRHSSKQCSAEKGRDFCLFYLFRDVGAFLFHSKHPHLVIGSTELWDSRKTWPKPPCCLQRLQTSLEFLLPVLHTTEDSVHNAMLIILKNGTEPSAR